MDKTYQPQDIEQRLYQIWEKSGFFKPSGQGPGYSITLPPPNVTGTLHMGHGFQLSLMDALIRYHRMMGFNTHWQAGTDHAGIATQLVVEGLLEREGTNRLELGREKFEDRIWQWKNQSDSTIKGQLRRMGASMDWERERFSLDDEINHAVRQVFVQLHEEGLIYRGQRLVNWDVKLQTAISDLEVSSEEEDSFLYHLRYPLSDNSGEMIVATTRPETLFGDVAVAVHPDDERYKKLIGKKVKLPLTDREIPILADEFVISEFGTGCVKITPAHDFNDYEVAQRHKLALMTIFTPDAHLNDKVPTAYRGLERFAAREKVVNDLDSQGLLVKKAPYKQAIPRNYRTGTILEPYLTNQWFIRTQPLAEPAIEAVKKGEIEFIPEHWNKIYFQWLENIQDWCISRQLWWGHRIPAWYDDEANVYVAETEQAVRQKYKLADDKKLHQDNDVLDTWFSAALWPFATLGWPEQTSDLQAFYPTQVLVTGFDIIFFWVARMVMMGLKFTGKVPFRQVYITGLIRDSEGQKMSKSKGNILDPIDLADGIDLASLVKKRTYGLMQTGMAERIQKNTEKEFPEGIPAFGTDALRFTFCALATGGRDIRFDLGRLEGYRNFCNKIWNAARYVLMNVEGQDLDFSQPYELSLADRWIRSRLNQTVQQVHTDFANYRFDQIAQTIYEFIWNEFCDWYVELSKVVLNNPDTTEAQKRGTRYTLLSVLEASLRLTHPLMPFITEEIWQRIAPLLNIHDKTIMLQPYPQFQADWTDEAADNEVTWLKKVIMGIRNIRGEMNVAPGKALSVLFRKGNANAKRYVTEQKNYLTRFARLEKMQWLADDEQPPESATCLVDDLEILIPLSGIIDKQAELARLEKEINKLTDEFAKYEKKLATESYIKNAPAAVIAKDKQRTEEIKMSLEKLLATKERISQI